jgi:hypothetical protein
MRFTHAIVFFNSQNKLQRKSILTHFSSLNYNTSIINIIPTKRVIGDV